MSLVWARAASHNLRRETADLVCPCQCRVRKYSAVIIQNNAVPGLQPQPLGVCGVHSGGRCGVWVGGGGGGAAGGGGLSILEENQLASKGVHDLFKVPRQPGGSALLGESRELIAISSRSETASAPKNSKAKPVQRTRWRTERSLITWIQAFLVRQCLKC